MRRSRWRISLRINLTMHVFDEKFGYLNILYSKMFVLTDLFSPSHSIKLRNKLWIYTRNTSSVIQCSYPLAVSTKNLPIRISAQHAIHLCANMKMEQIALSTFWREDSRFDASMLYWNVRITVAVHSADFMSMLVVRTSMDCCEAIAFYP